MESRTLNYGRNLLDHSSYEIVGIFITAFLLYNVVLGVYRITFHPLAKFPGPKLAGLTFWYEFYHDIWPNKFQYLWKIKALHEEYGPIIRINPITIHIDDPDFYEEIYAGSGRKRDRCRWFFHGNIKHIVNETVLRTNDHDLHRIRRGAFGTFFSKRSVANLESLMNRKVEKLVERIKTAMSETKTADESKKDIINMSYAMAGLTHDIITEYCFGSGNETSALDQPEYGRFFVDLLRKGVQTEPLWRQFPRFFITIISLPPWLLVKIFPEVSTFIEQDKLRAVKIEKIMNAGQAEPKDERNPSGASTSKPSENESDHRTIFHEIKDSNLPESEKSVLRLVQESEVLMGAGTETTARTLATLCFYLITYPEIRSRLVTEVKKALSTLPTDSSSPTEGISIWSPKVNLTTLQSLPYLNAVITESLRLSNAVAGRMPRVATQEDLIYTPGPLSTYNHSFSSSSKISTNKKPDNKTYIIPKGNSIAESAYLIHTNPLIFPDPLKFNPDRWLEYSNDKEDIKFSSPNLKYLVAFSKGSRACLGINLAYAELYKATVHILCRFKMELVDTMEERDVMVTNDCFIGMTDLNSVGVQVRILGEQED